MKALQKARETELMGKNALFICLDGGGLSMSPLYPGEGGEATGGGLRRGRGRRQEIFSSGCQCRQEESGRRDGFEFSHVMLRYAVVVIKHCKERSDTSTGPLLPEILLLVLRST